MAYKKTPLIYDRFPLKLWGLWSLAVTVSFGAGVLYFSPHRANLGAIPGSLHDAVVYLKQLIVYAIKSRQLSAPFIQANQAALYTGLMTVTAPAIVLLPFLVHLYAFSQRKPNDSRFATESDIKRIGLDGTFGPILGKLGNRLLKSHDPLHFIQIALTRSGKTLQAVSAILDFNGTCVVLDPKGQIETLTRPFREKIGPCMKLNFGDPNSPDGYNYFAVSQIPDEMHERELSAARLASALGGDSENISDPHWHDTFVRNLTALALFEMCEAKRMDRDGHPQHLIDFVQDLPPRSKKIKDPFAYKMAELAAIADANGYPDMIRKDLLSFATIEARERSAHISTMITKLQIFRLEASQTALGKDTICFDELREKPCTLYINFPPKHAATFGPLVSLFMDTLFTWGLSRDRNDGEYPVLNVFEEFRDLPPFQQLPSMCTRGAGAGFIVNIIVQSLAQVKERYPKTWHNIVHNMEYFLFYSSIDIDTMRMLQELIGTTTVEKKSRGMRSGEGGSSRNYSEADEALVNIKELGVIPKGKHIILAQRHLLRPILAQTAFWFKIPEIKKRVPIASRIKT